jgi:2-iminobutanoate/2-iminopropanoate deaminase
MAKHVIATTDAPAAIGPYSQAIAIDASRILFCSGQVALRPDGSFVGGDAATQTRQAMDNLAAVLAEAGMGFSNVVKTTIFLIDMADYGAVNNVYAEYFGGNAPPARAAVAVAALPKDARVEIQAIAAT